MQIKVCGMREPDNIKAVAALDIDMIGMIFYPKSKRYVSMISSDAGIIPDYSADRLKAMEKECAQTADHHSDTHPTSLQPQGRNKPKRVGVFVDDMPQNIVTRVYNYQLDYVQLHGNESPVMIENLKRTLVPDIAPHIGVIKAFAISSEADFAQCQAYEGVADLFLFDTQCDTKGGSGRHFDWSLLKAYQGHTPFLLSGGIGPDDADDILDIRHPMMAGIDLNSRFETAPAIKDVALLSSFITKIRQAH